VKKLVSVSVLVLLAFVFFIQSQFEELTYNFGFVEFEKVAFLENDQKIKVKCYAYAWGFFDEIKLENNFQKCVKDYEAEGYKKIENKGTS
jgi:hypothetical protein